MKILLTGGGTMGSVSPLVAIYEELKQRDPLVEALWIGTKNGPEKDYILSFKIPYKYIWYGKFRRYFSLHNLLIPFGVLIGMIQSGWAIMKFKPELVLTAGSFVAVPVAYVARLLNVPVFVHHQDLEKGLANKLMSFVASKITVTFSDSVSSFNKSKVVYISNPVRQELFNGTREEALKFFNLDLNIKTLFVFGGGLGAKSINQMVLEKIGELTKNYQIIHVTGEGKGIKDEFANYYDRQTIKRIISRYRSYNFLVKEINLAYKAADLVVCRAGLSTLTELAVLGKPSLLIPLPGQQDYNAQYFGKYNAVKVLPESKMSADTFFRAITLLIENPSDMQQLSRNISQMINKFAARNYVDLIYEFLDSRKKK